MKRILTKIGISALIILILTGLFIAMGSLVSMIPHSAVEENIRKSSIELGVTEVRHFIIDGEHSSLIDSYADAALLNILWHTDSEKPVESYLNAMYLKNKNTLQTQMLYKSAFEGAEANESYSRYWHGMTVFVRPLLTVTDLSGIRIINAVTLILLAAAFVYLLARRKLFSLIWGYLAACVMCWCVFVPTTMEYMPPFVLFHIFGCILLLWGEKLKPYMEYIFLVFGALTCYFDFLTTETLVFAVPMTILLCIEGSSGRFKSFKDAFTTTLRYGLFWLVGYGIFFPIKWLCAGLLQNSNTVIDSVRQAMIHMTDEGAHYAGIDAPMYNSVFANIGGVFPFTLCANSEQIIFVSLLAGALILFGCLYFKKKHLPSYTGMLYLMPLIPYARYLILPSHAFVHSFMTHRSQFSTIMAVFALFAYTIDRKKFFRSLPRKLKKKGKR